ncbi:hypothetical protein ACFO9Q_10825 [Paenibacillus sp. GCM10023252]|uniref:hypothetical protein n=1 Tax=Paenibacillus sp. GCM10023252 TaxID=3252649 RepID=UPI0036113DBF
MRIRLPLSILLLLTLLVSGSGLTAVSATSANMAVAAVGAAPPKTSLLQQHVERWIGQLSKNDAFHAWRGAGYETSPLGPGTHSWLVLVKQKKVTVGYLVVQALDDGGLSLGEYGLGSHPLYDAIVLRGAIERLELERAPLSAVREYVHPLLAVWKVKTDSDSFEYADAASGEWLPLGEELWKETRLAEANVLGDGLRSLTAALTTMRTNEPFDVYDRMPWLTASPLSLSMDAEGSGRSAGRGAGGGAGGEAGGQAEVSFTLPALLDSDEQIRYAAERYEGTALFVWSVIGYHGWNEGTVYAALQSSGEEDHVRYIPLTLLARLGSFYR